MKINSIIIEPVLTEKATLLAQTKIYAFHVHDLANKHQVREALKKLYNVKIGDVKILNREGKVRRTGKRMLTKQLPGKKIAYVKVLDGKIDVFPQA